MSFGKIQCVNIDKIWVYPTQPEALYQFDQCLLQIVGVRKKKGVGGDKTKNLP